MSDPRNIKQQLQRIFLSLQDAISKITQSNGTVTITQGGNDAIVTSDGELKVSDKLGKLISVEFNDVEVTSKVSSGNAIGEPETIIYRNSGNIVATLSITYDVDGCLQRAIVS